MKVRHIHAAVARNIMKLSGQAPQRVFHMSSLARVIFADAEAEDWEMRSVG